jgi:hypothetical protein
MESKDALRPFSMAGIATFTMVVSSRIMKKPSVRTSNTIQGFVTIRAGMSVGFEGAD